MQLTGLHVHLLLPVTLRFCSAHKARSAGTLAAQLNLMVPICAASWQA